MQKVTKRPIYLVKQSHRIRCFGQRSGQGGQEAQLYQNNLRAAGGLGPTKLAEVTEPLSLQSEAVKNSNLAMDTLKVLLSHLWFEQEQILLGEEKRSVHEKDLLF